MPFNLKNDPIVGLTRTDRLKVSDGDYPAEKFLGDWTTLMGNANYNSVIGWSETGTNDTVVIPKGSVVALNAANELTLPGAPYAPANVPLSTALKSRARNCGTGQNAIPIGVTENDIVYYAEEANAGSYAAAYKRGGDREGSKAIMTEGYIELPIIVASSSNGVISAPPNVVKWGCIMTDDLGDITPGCYLGVNGYGQFHELAAGTWDGSTSDVHAQVLYIWNDTQRAARFSGALAYLARINNMVIGTDGEPPLATVENSNIMNPYIIPNAAFGAGDQPSGYITMARIRLLFTA